MNRAIRILASVLGVYAGLLGATHGILEIRQGNVAPSSILIQAIGPPCDMSLAWHGCWPAVTVVPSMLASGVLAFLVSLAVVVWAVFFVPRKRGGVILMLLSLLMLPVGGGIIPVLTGVVAGAVGTRIGTPLAWWRKRFAGSSCRFLAALWPWSLAVYVLWSLAQYLLGQFWNDFMLQLGSLLVLLDFGLILLSVVTGFASDVRKSAESPETLRPG